jgi:hypothetical protein
MEDMLHGLEAIQRELPPSSTPEMLRRFGNISGEEPRVSPHTQAIDERIAELKRQASLPINTPSVGTNRNNQRLAREAREELRRLNQEWQIIGDAAEPPAAPPAAPRPYRREDVELLPYQQDQIRDLVGYMSTQGPTEVAQHIELLENELRELHAEGDAPYSEIAQTEDSIRELRYLQRHLTGATLPPGVTLPPAPPAEPPAPRPAHREVTIDDLRANQPSLLQRIFQGLRGIFDRVRPQRAESAPPALASEPQALGGSIPPSISEFRRLPRVPKVKPKEDPFLNANIYEDAAEGAKKLRSSEPLYEKPANRPYGELEDLRREQIPEMAFRRRRQRIEAAEKAEPPFKKNYQGDRIIPYYERRAVSRRIKNEMEELRQRRADVESATDRNDMDEQLVQYENSLRNRKEEHAENIARIMRNRFDGRRMLEGDVRQRPYVEGPMLPNHPPRSWFHKNIKKPIMRTIRRISNPNREPPMGDMQHLERAIRPEFNTPYHEDFLIRHSNAMRNYYMDPEDANRRKDYLDAEEELSRRGILNKDLLENQAAMPSLRRDIEKYRRMDDLSGKPLDDGLYTGSNYEVLEKQALRDAIQKEEILNAYRNPRDPRKRHTWNELTEPHYLPQFVGASTTDLRRRLASFDRGGRGNIDIEAMPEDIRKDFMRTNEELIRRQMSVMNNTELEDIRKKEPANMANWYSKMASDLAKEELHRRTAAGENRHSYLARVDQLSNIVRRREKLDRKWDEFMGLPPIDIPPRFSEAPQRRLPPPPPRYSPPADMRAGHMAARVANNPKFRKVRERFNNVDLVPATKEIQIPQSDGSVEHYEAHYRSPNPAVYHNYIPGRRQMLGLDLRWVPEQILRNTSRNTNSGWERSPSGFDFHRYMTTPPPPTSPPLRPPVQAQPQIMPIIEEMVIPKRTKKKGKAHVNFFKDEEKDKEKE